MLGKTFHAGHVTAVVTRAIDAIAFPTSTSIDAPHLPGTHNGGH